MAEFRDCAGLGGREGHIIADSDHLKSIAEVRLCSCFAITAWESGLSDSVAGAEMASFSDPIVLLARLVSARRCTMSQCCMKCGTLVLE